MVYFEEITKTTHYKKYHEKEVDWQTVIKTITTAKQRKLGKNLIEFKSKSFYVLAKIENLKLKIINAKKRKWKEITLKENQGPTRQRRTQP